MSPTSASDNDTLTAVPGLRVGHATVTGGGSGCTVILGPFRAAADVRGAATGTRELDALDPLHLVDRVNALLFTGGSAFGLSAADGVTAWLEERGEGFATRVAPVPIVPAAVIYDLAPGVERPGPETGRAACEAASGAPVPAGAVGAGAGASVGKVAGPEASAPGGAGGAATRLEEWTVGALAVVNAVGDVLDREGGIVAGARAPDGTFLDSARLLREGGLRGGFARREPGPGEHTTLAVVATDAPLTRVELLRVARMASAGIARRIVPSFTPFDGDVCFALSTAVSEESPRGETAPGGRETTAGSEESLPGDTRTLTPAEVLALGSVAREVLEEAIERAVRR